MLRQVRDLGDGVSVELIEDTTWTPREWPFGPMSEDSGHYLAYFGV